MIGLLVSNHGYPIGYQIFEGNTSETKTLIPILETFQKKFDIDKPIIIANAALLSKKILMPYKKITTNIFSAEDLKMKPRQ